MWSRAAPCRGLRREPELSAGADRRPSKAEIWLLDAAGLATFFGLLTALSAFGLVSRRFLPSPAAIAARPFFLLDLPYAGARLPMHVLSSLGHYPLAFLLTA